MATPATHIQFQDSLRPVNSHGGGIYTLRSRAHSGIGSIRSNSLAKVVTGDGLEDANDVDGRDFKVRQEFGRWKVLLLAYQSVGVIYGDIGTSPLYVYSSTLSTDPGPVDLLGVLSLIIWSLIIMVSIKYVLIVLRADDEGEGGTFALYSLLSRYANIVQRDPREAQSTRLQRLPTQDLGVPAAKTRNFLERSRTMQVFLKALGVFGVSLVMSDGILTPAQSVLGAIQGIRIIQPSISTSAIIGISCGILVLLFAIQPFGTCRLAGAFAPVVTLWLMFNFGFGVYNLVVYEYTVLKAFSPHFAFQYLVRNKTEGWKSLGGVLLSFTGCEALFADLGAFTRRSIQLSWLGFAFPCLLLAYIGQAAYIAHNPGAYANPFFASVPPGWFWPSFILSILAAIVASQAMITAVFQLLSQLMKLSYFPQIKTIHTSKEYYGHIYMPFANWLMMFGTVIITAVYSNTTRLGHAYGVCVILVSFITTNMVALVALIVWRTPSYIVAFVWLTIAAFEGAFLSSALTKVPVGAWFTLCLAIILSSCFTLWRFGKEQQWHAEASDRFPPSHMLKFNVDKSLHLSPTFGGHSVTKLDGIGVFFDKAGSLASTATVLIHFLEKLRAVPEVMILFHLRPLETPTVPVQERYAVTRCFISSSKGRRSAGPNFYRIIIRHGYNDEIITENLGLLLYEQLRTFIIREGVRDFAKAVKSETEDTEIGARSGEELLEMTRTPSQQDVLAERLVEIQKAYDKQVVYVVGKEQMRIKKGSNFFRKALLDAFLWVRENSRSKVQALDLCAEKLVEVGFVKQI